MKTNTGYRVSWWKRYWRDVWCPPRHKNLRGNDPRRDTNGRLIHIEINPPVQVHQTKIQSPFSHEEGNHITNWTTLRRRFMCSGTSGFPDFPALPPFLFFSSVLRCGDTGFTGRDQSKEKQRQLRGLRVPCHANLWTLGRHPFLDCERCLCGRSSGRFAADLKKKMSAPAGGLGRVGPDRLNRNRKFNRPQPQQIWPQWGYKSSFKTKNIKNGLRETYYSGNYRLESKNSPTCQVN